MSEKSYFDEMSEREMEAIQELGRMGFDDPNRAKVLSEVKTYSDIRLAHEAAEQKRFSDNAHNDIEEARLIIEDKKLRNERKRMRVDIGRSILYVIGGIGTGVLSYGLDTCFQKFTPLQRFGEKLHELSIKFSR